MAKHTAKKPRKKREQPWMQAARDKLRGGYAFTAFTRFATPLINPFAREADIQVAFDAARFAWNLPLSAAPRGLALR